jgi:Zn finger protein HypA/HybF involved in hydrogenase expression
VHEFSIAEALAAQVEKHARPGARVRVVEIVAGALRGIEPEALQMGWQAVTMDTRMEGSALLIEQRPWSISCPACGRSWSSPVPFVSCECGNDTPEPHGTDELNLLAITIDDEDGEEQS